MLKLKKIEAEKAQDYPEVGARFLPTLYLDSKQVSEIRDWEVGEEYTLVIKVKQTGKNENDKEKDGKVNSVRADFDIVGYKVLNDEMSDADLEEMQAKGLSS